MSKRIISALRLGGASPVNPFYASPFSGFGLFDFSGSRLFDATERSTIHATVRNLILPVDTPAGPGNGWRCVFMVNGTETALEGTCENAETEFTVSGEATIAPGDEIVFKFTPIGSPPILSPPSYCLEVDSLTPGQSAYDVYWTTLDVEQFRPLFGGGRVSAGPSSRMPTAADASIYMPTSGVLKALSFKGRSGFGAHLAHVVVMLNGVAQDGENGTVDTQLTLSCGGFAQVYEYKEFELPLNVGDEVYLRYQITDGQGFLGIHHSVLFEADIPGESIISHISGDAPNVNILSATPPHPSMYLYSPIFDFVSHGWSRSSHAGSNWGELNVITPIGPSGWGVRKLYARSSVYPASAYHVAVHKNGVATALQVTLTSSERLQGNTERTIGFVDGDHATLSFTNGAAGNPTPRLQVMAVQWTGDPEPEPAAQLRWSAVQYTAPRVAL